MPDAMDLMNDDSAAMTTVTQPPEDTQIVQFNGKYIWMRTVVDTEGCPALQIVRDATPDEVQVHFFGSQNGGQQQQAVQDGGAAQQQVLVTQDGEHTSMQPHDAMASSPVHAVDSHDVPARALPATLDRFATDFPGEIPGLLAVPQQWLLLVLLM